MKVYIILDDSNDLGLGASVEKVFSDKEKAVDYVYAGWMKRSAYVAYYVGKSKQDLMQDIEFQIHESEIE